MGPSQPKPAAMVFTSTCLCLMLDRGILSSAPSITSFRINPKATAWKNETILNFILCGACSKFLIDYQVRQNQVMCTSKFFKSLEKKKKPWPGTHLPLGLVCRCCKVQQWMDQLLSSWDVIKILKRPANRLPTEDLHRKYFFKKFMVAGYLVNKLIDQGL